MVAILMLNRSFAAPSLVLRLTAVILAAWSLAACESQTEPPPPDYLTELKGLPSPNLENHDPGVRAQLDQLRQAVRTKARSAVTPAGIAPQLLALGEAYQAYEQFAAAQWCYEWIEERMPGRTDAGYLLANMAADTGHFDQAISRIEAWIEQHPDNWTAHYRHAEWLDSDGKSNAARMVLDQVLSAQPQHAPALALRGSLRMAAGENEAALEDLQRAAQIKPEAGQVNYMIGQILAREGRRDEARAFLSRREGGMPVVEDPISARVQGRAIGVRSYLASGSNAMRNGRFDVAAVMFDKARIADPQNPTAWLNLGASLAQSGRLSEAMQALEGALKLDLSDANRSRTHFNMGLMAASEGDAVAAREHLENAVELDPENRQARQALNNLLSQLNSQ